MSFRDLGIPKENIEQIENACERIYLHSRKLKCSEEQKDICLNQLIEELVKKAIEKNKGDKLDISGFGIKSIDELEVKFIEEIKNLISQNKDRLDSEAGYLSLKEIQGDAELVFQFEYASKVIEEKEPSLDFVIKQLNQLNAESNTFCILSEKSLSYIQSAGSTDRLTIEYRRYEGRKFKHFILGKRKLFKSRTSVYFSGREIPVKSNEVLNINNAIEVYQNFYLNRQIPQNYVLRDITNTI